MNARSKRSSVARFILVATLLVVRPGISMAESLQFSAYPALEKVEGSIVPPHEEGAPDSWKAVNPAVKKIIAEQVQKGPNFAGAYFLATVGCGTSCEAIFVIDVRDGEIFHAPVTGTNGVLFQNDSQLIVVNENELYDLPRKYITFDGALFGELN